MTWRNQRISGDLAHMAEVTALRNFQRYVQIADRIKLNSVASTCQVELDDGLRKLMPEVDAWPVRYQHALLRKRVHVLLAKQDWKLLIEIIDPYKSPHGFDPLLPTMPALQDGTIQKVKVFEAVLFQSVLLPLVFAGAEQSDTVLSVVKLALDTCEAAGLCEMDSKTATSHAEMCSILRCLQALATSTLDCYLADDRCIENRKYMLKSVCRFGVEKVPIDKSSQ